jgi:hypothetical protein
MSQEINQTSVGMDMDSHISNMSPNSYSLAVNANIQDVSGNLFRISNEPSNLLCTRFKEGYSVIGTLNISIKNIVIFFLVNESTKDSEIGMIRSSNYEDIADEKVFCSTCNASYIEGKPLELIEQKELCQYETIINAPCLNFNINFPIRSSFSIGYNPNNNLPNNESIVIYFTDYNNGMRFLDISHIPYIVQSTGDCGEIIYTNQLDCSKILVNEPFNIPCLNTIEDVIGGSLKAGTYQFSVSYSNSIGVELTDYFTISNPFPIYDTTNTITVNTDYLTSQAIKLSISNLDAKRYNYINIIVLITVNNTTSIFQIGTFSINSNNFIYTFTGNEYDSEARLTIDDVLRRRPLYNKAEGITKANDFLFWYGLEAQRELNLQPVVNKLHLKWQTIEVPSDFYSNSNNAANYVGYNRDEVYAFSIYFKLKGGGTTADFILSNNDKQYYKDAYKMKDTIDNYINTTDVLDVDYIVTDGNELTAQGCPSQEINKLWQVYNTAQDEGQSPNCPYNASGVQIVDTYKYFSCNSDLYTNDPQSSTPPFYYSKINNIGGIEPNTKIYSSDNITFYNINNTLLTNCGCIIPSGYNNIADSIIFKTLQAPQINTSVSTYTQTNLIHSPKYNTTFADAFGAGTGNAASQVLNSDLFVPINKTCATALQIAPSTNGACRLNPTTNQPNDYAYLARVSSPTDLYNPSGCAGCQSCNSFGTCYTDNQVWYSFIATAKTHAINLGLSGINSGLTNTKFSLEVFQDCLGSCPIACSSPQDSSTGIYLLVGDVANGQIALTVGQTYYFRIFTPDPTTITNDANPSWDQNSGLFGQAKWGFATICITTPTVIGSKIIDIPGIYEFECIYKSLVPTPTQVYVNAECEKQTYHIGDFAYWKSSESYPNNKDVYAELCSQPIRHFKFPDCRVANIQNSAYNASDRSVANRPTQYTIKNKFYPIGVNLDVESVKEILIDAEISKLISNEERLNIVGYGIKRSNRRSNKSILANGLLYDVWKSNALNSKGEPIKALDGSQSFEKIYYPSYSYNDLNTDVYLLDKRGGSNVKHPYKNNNYVNARYTFHSPNTSFNKPFLGNIIKLESIQYGISRGEYVEVVKHAPYTLLTKQAYTFAEVLAALEIVIDAFNAASAAAPITIFGTSAPLVGFAIELAIGIGFGFATNQGKYTKEFTDLFKSLGIPRNPTIYYISDGKYNSSSFIENGPYKKISVTSNNIYLNPGNIQINDNYSSVRINNFERESSIFFSIPAYDATTPDVIIPAKAFQCVDWVLNNGALIYDVNGNLTGDTSRTDAFNNIAASNQLQTGVYSNIASYYASNKIYVPDQYGTIENIEWVDTGYCGIIDWNNIQDSSCDTIFGGDTYINNFGLKRKMPFFIQDRINDQPNTDVQYSLLSNVAFSKYYMDTAPVDPSGSQAFFNFTPPELHAIVDESSVFYQRGYFPMYSYGIPYFACESDYNVDMRHGENYQEKNFYPYVGDIVTWTQQYLNPISFDNYYFYNSDYSKQNLENPYYILRNDYTNALSYIRNQFPNRAIYSNKGVPNWLNYSANDYYDFPLEDGALIALNGIEQDKVVCRQTNSTKVFNAYITINTSLEQQQVSIGNMFATKPQEYYKSDLGFGGSTHQSFESTPFGHFYVNSENPSIFQLGGNQLIDITRGKDKPKMRAWFREHLPFSIRKDFPDVNIDDAYNKIGIATTWDNKYDRMFITKLDYALNSQYKGKVEYKNNAFYLNGEEINLKDKRYFCNKSWTLAYSPINGEWISFYSFIPNYYISNNTYFQSGNSTGLWSHLLTNKSYQVFYEELFPFIIEYVTQDKFINNTVDFIEYQCDVLRYEDMLNYFFVNDRTLDGVLIYNQNQTTGQLNLIVAKKDDMQQSIAYPKINHFSKDILVDNIENNWRFNSITDVSVKGQPLMTYTCEVPYKNINTKALNYKEEFLTKQLRSDAFIVRLSNNNDSQHKYIMKFQINNQTISKT